jgi:tyrosine-protein kinase Etk/Wzc
MGSEEFKNIEDNVQRYKENVSELTQEFELGLFLYLVNKVKWYAILILITSFIGALLYLRYTPENYETSALIQVAVKEQPNGFGDLYTYDIGTNLSSEIALMNSQKAIDRVIKDLGLEVFYYFEGEVLTRFLYNKSVSNWI